jgi:glycosyltransferase involved in cell wall biosynthesis
MHILYVQQILVLPGEKGNDRCWAFAKSWVEAGHKVSFLTSTSGFTQENTTDFQRVNKGHYRFQGIEIYTVEVDYAHKMSFPKRMVSFLRFVLSAYFRGRKIKNVDIVLAYTPPLSVAWLGQILARFHQKPLVLEVADAWPEVPIGMGIIKNAQLIKFLRRKTRQIYDFTSYLFPFSDGIKEEIIKYGIPEEKIQVIYNGADLDRFQPITPISKEKTTFIYTGTLGIANQVSQILEAAQKIEQMGRLDLEFIIIGDGNDRDRVMDYATENPCSLVKFYDSIPRKELVTYLARADAGLVCFAPYPILETNSATKFYDYLSLGLPVIINYQGWQADYLQSHQCGLASPQGDIDQFVYNILKLADNPNLRAIYGGNGRKLAEGKFDRKKMAVQELKLIEALLS